MTFADPVGDMITRIRNAQMRLLNNVRMPSSKFREKILDVLKQEGYIADYKLLSDSNNKGNLSVDLKYNNGLPVIKEIKRVSKPGRRIYVRATSIPKIKNGLGLAIVSTSIGIMTDNDARSKNVGGEIICKVFWFIMSKIGKKPIQIPKDTKIKVESGKLILSGPKGSKQLSLNDKIFAASITEDNNLILKLIKKNETSNIMWGTTRSIINNALLGVTVGYEKILELTGVGYRAILTGNVLKLKLGFSHDVSYEIPQEVKLTIEKSTIIKIHGIDKELVGKVASEIKILKPVEPYKGKGIKERGQYVLRKEGKKK